MWKDLQQPLLERCDRIEMHEGAKALYSKLKRRLITAATEGVLKHGHGSVANLLNYIPAPHRNDLPHGMALEEGWKYSLILGGEKVMRQENSGRQFERDDEAWFHFAITLREKKRQALELVAYNFEIVFPGEHRGPRFVRFDLNPPDHQNTQRDMRSHMHPGIDEESLQGQVPAPVLDPTEALELFVNHLRWTRR